MKSKGKRIGVIVLALLLLIGGGIFTVTLLHPDRFIPPDEIITRGEFAAILVRDIPLDTKGAEKDPPSFQDIDGHWSEKNIEALIDAGILDPADYPDGLFRPDEPISRAEIIKMLVRVNGKDNEARNTEGHSGYADDEEIGPDDKGYVIIGKEDGIIGDTPDNTICPDDPVTKGEADDMIDKTKPEEPAPTSETPAPSEPGPTTPTPAPTPDKPDNGGGSGGSGGGGGSTSYPAAQVRFELPATAHTDTEILVAPVWKYMSTFIWTLTKTAADGTQQPAPDAISGMLGKEGGTIRFLQDGEYTLTATALNARGKATILSRQITVYPVADVTFELPETLHTDKSVPLAIPLEKLHGHDIVWTAEKDGAAAQPADILDGGLGNEGGDIVFKSKGEYTLTAEITDETGRVFTHSENTVVYPVAGIAFELPATAHTDTALEIAAALTEADGLTVNWSLTKNGEPAVLADELEGSLTDAGGTIRFTGKGVYMLSGTLTDETGRVFEASQTITVYPVGSIGFYVPEITHTDTAVQVESRFENLGAAEIQWSLTRDGEAVGLSDAVQGGLTNDGGSIRFITKGSYILKASFTDPAGRSYGYSAPIKVYPVPGISYALPEAAHTDTIVRIDATTSELHGLTAEWLLENSFGFQDFGTYMSGTLNNSGGSIRFKHAGVYELIARITDETGRVFLFENGGRIEVLPVLSIDFELPEATHTDRTVSLRTRGNNNALPVNWSLTKNGEPAVLADAIEGTFNAFGGDVRFKEAGTYTLTAAMTDALGRVFSYSASTAVYPIPRITLVAPQVWYAGEAGEVSVSGADLEGMTAAWTLAKDGGEAEPYSIYASGVIGTGGGVLSIGTDKTISVKLIAAAADANGRTFTFESNAATIKPVAQFPFTLPSSVHIGSGFNVTMQAVSGLEGKSLAWSLTKGSSPASYNGSLTNSGGNINITATGSYTLTASVTDSEGRTFSHSQSVTVTNTAPNKPTGSATVHRTAQNGKLLVTFAVNAADPDGDAVSYEYSGHSADGYYAVGSHTVRVRAKDAWGLTSDWTDISFVVNNSAPTTPVITRTPSGNAVPPGTAITITASSTDPDGDAITYVWEGRPAQTSSAYPLGKNTVRVKAVDSTGAESSWAAIVFFVADPTPAAA